MICRKSDSDSTKKIIDILKNGGIAVLPTDTVYGFSGLADDVNHCDQRIRKIKGREESKPFIQLISSPQKISAYTDDCIPEALLAHWPGPLTIIVNDKRFSDKKIKTAFRCPGDIWLRSILEELDFPLYSTSVNRSGKPVLDEEGLIVNEFENEVDLIVLDGDKKNALPSTIVQIEDSDVRILRQGSLII